jgi:Flp pilus assembly pilin Flp
MRRKAKNGFRHQRGQNTAEYTILLILVAVGTIGLVSGLGQTLKEHFANAVAAMSGDNASVEKISGEYGKAGNWGGA